MLGGRTALQGREKKFPATPLPHAAEPARQLRRLWELARAGNDRNAVSRIMAVHRLLFLERFCLIKPAIRTTHPARSLFNSCSQMRATRKSLSRSLWRFARSRSILRWIFACQNGELVFGMWPHRGQPCQKQPSTKTAIRSLRKTKSGLPGSARLCIFHPLIPARTNASLKRTSVVRLFRPRMPLKFFDALAVTPEKIPSGRYWRSARSI
jgi:hypothetical protein